MNDLGLGQAVVNAVLVVAVAFVLAVLVKLIDTKLPGMLRDPDPGSGPAAPAERASTVGEGARRQSEKLGLG